MCVDGKPGVSSIVAVTQSVFASCGDDIVIAFIGLVVMAAKINHYQVFVIVVIAANVAAAGAHIIAMRT